MESLTAVLAALRDSGTEWRQINIADLQFWHRDAARLALLALVGVAAAALAVRLVIARRPERDLLALPAVLTWVRRSSLSSIRYVPFLPFVLGVFCFALAFADPYTLMTQEEVSFPGRRISLMIDASSSMIAPFRAARLNERAPADAVFFTSVGAAEHFVQRRREGRYRDLMALVEFGDEAYVITPFTHDYDNILLSISLIGDPTEWGDFPDKGTVIAQAIDQSVGLFEAFDFLNAAGNVMVIISDGQDSQFKVQGRDLSDILSAAVEATIPIYFIRVSYNRQFGANIPDEMWKAAVERTGGKFYAAANEEAILRAIREIDRSAIGEISVRRYSTQQPRFSSFALMAVGLWVLAAATKLGVPYFQKFP